MKKAVIITAMLLGTGVAYAAPAPVEDIGGGSSEDRIARLERIIKARQQAEFETMRRMDTLQQEVLELRGLTEQQNYQINQMLQRQRQLYDEIANLQSKPAAPAVSQTPSNVVASSSLSETDSYQRAVDLVLKERQYDAAIPAFRDFIKQYPNSASPITPTIGSGNCSIIRMNLPKPKPLLPMWSITSKNRVSGPTVWLNLG